MVGIFFFVVIFTIDEHDLLASLIHSVIILLYLRI